MPICPSCGGRGKRDAVYEELCSHCAGTGRDPKSKLMLEQCLFCNGKGRKTWIGPKVCESCHGSGRVKY